MSTVLCVNRPGALGCVLNVLKIPRDCDCEVAVGSCCHLNAKRDGGAVMF